MAAIGAFLGRLTDFFIPPARPMRLFAARRVRLFAAVTSGTLATFALLAAYYVTLELLPPAPAHRFDVAQFLGTLLDPPIPTAITWWIGTIALFGAYGSYGIVYAVLLCWAVQSSDVQKGIGFGIVLFLGLALTLTVSNGFHPAIMRNALPDTGLFLLGWSPWATVQLLLVHLLYGATLGALYQRLTHSQ